MWLSEERDLLVAQQLAGGLVEDGHLAQVAAVTVDADRDARTPLAIQDQPPVDQPGGVGQDTDGRRSLVRAQCVLLVQVDHRPQHSLRAGPEVLEVVELAGEQRRLGLRLLDADRERAGSVVGRDRWPGGCGRRVGEVDGPWWSGQVGNGLTAGAVRRSPQLLVTQ